MNGSETRQDGRLRQVGFSLIELMVASLIGAMLLIGLVQVAAGARSSFELQEAVGELQERARQAADSVAGILRQSGFSPEPWNGAAPAMRAIWSASDSVRTHSDRLTLRTRSERNCFGALNPVRSAAGAPAFYLRESTLELNASRNLALTCRYGPDEASLETQIPRQGLVPGVEAFQALFAEDSDGNGNADRWVRAGGWSDHDAIVGIQIGLMLASPEAPGERTARTFNVLDHVVTPAADGRLRRVVTVAHAFRRHGS